MADAGALETDPGAHQGFRRVRPGLDRATLRAGGHGSRKRSPKEAPQMTADFTKLKTQVEEADRKIRDAVAEDSAELRSMVDEARQSADDRAAELRAKADEVGDSAESHWREVQASWDSHVKQLRERIDAKKAEYDVAVAERDADWAEADAYDAVQFASAAIEEAEYAVLDAVLARRDADVLAAAR